VRWGFYFAPSYGYYNVPTEYYGHRWSLGEYLPDFLMRYRISDFDYYGLAWPPAGCAWFWVGQDAVLADTFTGEIIDVVYNLY